MKIQTWVNVSALLILTGCSMPIQTETPKPTVVVDYDHAVSDPTKNLLPPPSVEDLVLPESSKMKEPLKLQLERLESYNEYIERSIGGLQTLLYEGELSRKDARRALDGMVFDCSVSVFDQIELEPEPSAQLAVEGLDDRKLADAALNLAIELKNHSEVNLRRITEGVNRYMKACK